MMKNKKLSTQGATKKLNSALTKMEQECKRWVEDTQMFQRIVGEEETPAAELEAEWTTFTNKRRKREMTHLQTHLIIAQEASR